MSSLQNQRCKYARFCIGDFNKTLIQKTQKEQKSVNYFKQMFEMINFQLFVELGVLHKALLLVD